MRTICPTPADLLQHLCGDAPPAAAQSIALHLSRCAHCRGEAAGLRRSTAALRLTATTPSDQQTDCLTDEELAAALDSGAALEASRLTHLAECGRCRSRLASAQRVLGCEELTAELRRLHVDEGTPRRRSARGYASAAAMLAAAVVAGIVLRSDAALAPGPAGADAPIHRESAITTTAAPEILAPGEVATATASLVWTSVPHADRYRVTISDAEGTLVWEDVIADTTATLPATLRDTTARLYLWKVDARTGLDRWVSSPWQELLLTPTPDLP